MDIIKTLKRLMLWNIGLIILLLIDEYIKEGYLIKTSDFLKLFTHENLLSIGLMVLAIIISIYVKEKKKLR
jgi:ABC-type thiamin/hydroxymethylpyrimidine transport system permease subunit